VQESVAAETLKRLSAEPSEPQIVATKTPRADPEPITAEPKAEAIVVSPVSEITPTVVAKTPRPEPTTETAPKIEPAPQEKIETEPEIVNEPRKHRLLKKNAPTESAFFEQIVLEKMRDRYKEEDAKRVELVLEKAITPRVAAITPRSITPRTPKTITPAAITPRTITPRSPSADEMEESKGETTEESDVESDMQESDYVSDSGTEEESSKKTVKIRQKIFLIVFQEGTFTNSIRKIKEIDSRNKKFTTKKSRRIERKNFST
jgi:hypothetical protein